MIKGVHTMFYSSKAQELREFIREKLGFSATDVGEGWLIFDLPEAEMGVHPTDGKGAASGTPDISFYCEDIQKTVKDLKKKGVEFVGKIVDQGHGLVTYFKMPGVEQVKLYQPKYDLKRSQKTEVRRRGRRDESFSSGDHSRADGGDRDEGGRREMGVGVEG